MGRFGRKTNVFNNLMSKYDVDKLCMHEDNLEFISDGNTIFSIGVKWINPIKINTVAHAEFFIYAGRNRFGIYTDYEELPGLMTSVNPGVLSINDCVELLPLFLTKEPLKDGLISNLINIERIKEVSGVL